VPWSPEEFREHHAKKLSLPKAAKGRSIAEAMIRRGVPEGEAIATGIARAKGQKPKRHAKPFGSLAP